MYTYQQLKLKNKLNKEAEQKQNHRYGEWFDGNQVGAEMRGKAEKLKHKLSVTEQLWGCTVQEMEKPKNLYS